MKKKIKILSFAFFVFIRLSLCLAAADLHIYLGVQSENMGDCDQVRTLARALVKNYREGKTEIVEFDLMHVKPEEIQKQMKSAILASQNQEDLYLLLTVSTYGVTLIKRLFDIDRLYIAYLAHQQSPNYAELINYVDVFILPKHASNENFLKTLSHSKAHLIETIGVLNSLKHADLIEEYEKNKSAIPEATSYLGVILGGDAPTEKGEINYFSQKDSEKLAEYVGVEAQKHQSTVLVLNGPRTGKYNQKTGQIDPTAHLSEEIDAITLAFQKKLQTFIPKERIVLYNFQFGKVNYYKSVLGALLHASGTLLVPGESTSMVSELVENFQNRVLVYENGAMNSTHMEHVKSEYNAGRVRLFTRDFQEYPSKLAAHSFGEGQSVTVAKEVLRILTDLKLKSNRSQL